MRIWERKVLRRVFWPLKERDKWGSQANDGVVEFLNVGSVGSGDKNENKEDE